MDAWSDDELDRLERRVDSALRTDDDGRTLIVAPAAIKDLIAAFRHLRARATPEAGPPGPSARRTAYPPR